MYERQLHVRDVCRTPLCQMPFPRSEKADSASGTTEGRTPSPVREVGVMDHCLHDLLFLWAFHNCPAFLEDVELFQKLHDWIHALLVETRRKEIARTLERFTKVLPCSRN